MSANISKYPKLLVISDTGMYQEGNSFYAFGPVVKELEELSCFERITWVGFEKSNEKKNSSFVKICNKRINLKLLPPSGGKSILSKLLILFAYPIYFIRILKEVYSSKHVHVRAPSNPAVIAMLLSYFFPSKYFWFKYAGNWIGEASPFYKLQRMLLKKLGKNSKVTVNGVWVNQPENIIGFENPCLDIDDRVLGKEVIAAKQIKGQVNYCFVGGMNSNKGVDKIIEVLERFNHKKLGVFHFVGGGELLEDLKTRSASFSNRVVFHGFLAKQEIYEIYKKCHFIVLPSKSEGFPKVIGEAMNYGCVPIVSDVSCIGQYIHHKKNGYLISPINITEIETLLLESLEIENDLFNDMILQNYSLAEKFTYAYYEEQILSKVF